MSDSHLLGQAVPFVDLDTHRSMDLGIEATIQELRLPLDWGWIKEDMEYITN